MSNTKVEEFGDNQGPVNLSDREFREWVLHHMLALQRECMEKYGLKNIPQFAARVGISISYFYKLQRGESSPTIETLNQWLSACDCTLGSFFLPMLSRAELLASMKENEADRQVLKRLALGLANKRTRRIIEGTAETVKDLLSLDDQ